MHFTKMHGIGNDYIYIEQGSKLPRSLADLAILLSRRNFSVGSDGLIEIGRSERADVSMRIFNADGSEAEMCGNGLRCLAKYAYDHGLVKGPEMTVETAAGVVRARIIATDGPISQVEVMLPEPELTPALVPFEADHAFIDEPLEGIEPGLAGLNCTVLNLGNPHCVIFLAEDVGTFPVQVWGPRLETKAIFPERVNVGFATPLSATHVRVRVWERGSGETLACGSGASACVVAGLITGKLSSPCRASLPGGDVSVAWMRGQGVLLTGPAEEVYQGEIPYQSLGPE
ncbi:diaminopimelate epimerase [bacterium]|nr:diaminopimelate epimerase [bacterium]